MFPWDEPTRFVGKIEGAWGIGGIKCHTFRVGQRWSPGDKIHFWSNSPRNPRSHPYAFNLADPRSAVYWHDVRFGQPLDRTMMPRIMKHWPVKHEEYVPLVWAVEEFKIAIAHGTRNRMEFRLQIGENLLIDMLLDPLKEYHNSDFSEAFKWVTYREGFDTAYDFIRWFWNYKEMGKDLLLEGQVIHWQDTCLYDRNTAKIFTI